MTKINKNMNSYSFNYANNIDSISHFAYALETSENKLVWANKFDNSHNTFLCRKS